MIDERFKQKIIDASTTIAGYCLMSIAFCSDIRFCHKISLDALKFILSAAGKDELSSLPDEQLKTMTPELAGNPELQMVFKVTTEQGNTIIPQGSKHARLNNAEESTNL